MSRINLMRNRFILAFIILCLFLASIAYSGSIVNSRHDMIHVTYADPTMDIGGIPAYINDYNKEICVYCHTPHNANTMAPLWNRNTPAGPYGIYNSSATLEAATGQPNGLSLACLSCHDGIIAVDSIINQPSSGLIATPGWHYQMKLLGPDNCGLCHTGAIGSGHDSRASYLGIDLSDDHPISIDYNDLTTQFGTEFNTPPDLSRGWPGNDIKLYFGYVECPSCHDVHDPDIPPFLRISNADSALCTKCHMK